MLTKPYPVYRKVREATNMAIRTVKWLTYPSSNAVPHHGKVVATTIRNSVAFPVHRAVSPRE